MIKTETQVIRESWEENFYNDFWVIARNTVDILNKRFADNKFKTIPYFGKNYRSEFQNKKFRIVISAETNDLTSVRFLRVGIEERGKERKEFTVNFSHGLIYSPKDAINAEKELIARINNYL